MEKIVGGIDTILRFQSGSVISLIVMIHYLILSSGNAMTMNMKERKCVLKMTNTARNNQTSITTMKKNIQSMITRMRLQSSFLND